jgi:SOS-response transcriptional repressor LexA
LSSKKEQIVLFLGKVCMIEGMKERFASIRKEQGLNVKEFAESLDMEPTTVSSIESGKREPSKEVLLNLAIKYAYSLNWIFTGIGEKRLTKAILPEQTKPPLLENLEKLIDERTGRYGHAISNLESRLSALESRLNTTQPEAGYPPETGDGGDHTVAPEYGEEEPTGTVAFFEDIIAGPPIGQSDDRGMVMDVPLRFIKTRLEDYYVLRVWGNSMIDALIPDGSTALIRRSEVPKDGIIQLVWIDGRTTLKRMREGEDHDWTLCYEDGTGRTIPLGDENQVQGDFVAVLPPSTRPRKAGSEEKQR